MLKTYKECMDMLDEMENELSVLQDRRWMEAQDSDDGFMEMQIKIMAKVEQIFNLRNAVQTFELHMKTHYMGLTLDKVLALREFIKFDIMDLEVLPKSEIVAKEENYERELADTLDKEINEAMDMLIYIAD